MEDIIKKYFRNINFIFFTLIFLFYFIESYIYVRSDYTYTVCFVLIATLGVSHGALDAEQGRKMFAIKYRFWKPIFYFVYLTLVILVFFGWYLNSVISLIIFLIIAAFHFGKEDLEIYLKKDFVLKFILFFLKGSLIILLPLYFNFYDTIKIFNEILFVYNFILITPFVAKIFLSINLILQSLLFIYVFYIRQISLFDFLNIIFEITSIIFLFYLFKPIAAFTMYFCFMHSFKNISILSFELNNNILLGFKKFFKKAFPLTIITFFSLIVLLLLIGQNETWNSAIQKVIFIGLASLTLPHVILHFLSENFFNNKKFSKF